MDVTVQKCACGKDATNVRASAPLCDAAVNVYDTVSADEWATWFTTHEKTFLNVTIEQPTPTYDSIREFGEQAVQELDEQINEIAHAVNDLVNTKRYFVLLSLKADTNPGDWDWAALTDSLEEDIEVLYSIET